MAPRFFPAFQMLNNSYRLIIFPFDIFMDTLY